MEKWHNSTLGTAFGPFIKFCKDNVKMEMQIILVHNGQNH